ncbi:MAG: type II toxin-antitoxin system HicB family antitoxin [Fimbriimonas sp.]
MRQYTVVLERAEDGTWGAYVPDLPGCTAGGATMDEAKERIHLSIELWLEEMRSAGAIPPPPVAKSFEVSVAA